MTNKRFYFAWILGAIIMYAAFFCWHGLILTDFSRVNYPKPLFFSFAAITYLLISYIIYKIFEIKFWDNLTKNYFSKALFTGITVGFLLFVVTTVLGISFSIQFSFTHFVTDCVWQIIEQTTGGIVVAFCHIHIYAPKTEEEF